MKFQTYVPVLIGALMLVLSPTVIGQEVDEQPIQEVFRTRLVYPQERGELQLTFTSRFGRRDGHSMFQTPSLEYGITDRWQMEVEWDGHRHRVETGEVATRGVGDMSIGTQYSFMNMAGSKFHSAAGVEVVLPLANIEKELTEGFVEYEPYFIVARDFPKLNRMQLFSQIGLGLVQRVRHRADLDEDEPAAHEFNLSAGMFVPFRKAVFTGEYEFSTNRWNNRGQEREMSVTPGVVFKLPRNWEIGLGAPIGLTHDADKLGIVFKLIYEFNIFRRDEK
jgi:hypothetical protein